MDEHNNKTENFAVVDVGGTNTRIALNFQSFSRFKKISIKTLQDYNKQIHAIHSILKDNKVSITILGIASPIDFGSGQLLCPPNISDYKNQKPVVDFAKLGIEIELINDLELAAIGEATYGAGKNNKVVALVSMATGAGGALVKDRNVIRGRYNFEPGHHIFESNVFEVPGKTAGSFEAALSGSALHQITHQDPAKLSDSFYSRQVGRLCQILTNFSVFWSPEVIVLVGPISSRFKGSLSLIESKLNETLRVFPAPKVVLGKLGDNAALAGGYALAKNIKGK